MRGDLKYFKLFPNVCESPLGSYTHVVMETLSIASDLELVVMERFICKETRRSQVSGIEIKIWSIVKSYQIMMPIMNNGVSSWKINNHSKKKNKYNMIY